MHIGTPSYDNWRAFNDGEKIIGESEYLLYTDASFIGEPAAGLGPYKFFNLLPFASEPGLVQPAAALRLSIHIIYESPQMHKTDVSRYHGGLAEDEIAALASLKCGVRLRSGSQTRMFEANGDPHGRPVSWIGNRADPVLGQFTRTRRLVLPTVTGEHSMMPIEEMKSFPLLAPRQAIALVRAARLYQDALWLSESEPNLSWLMLVSAVEAAAKVWRASQKKGRSKNGLKKKFVVFLLEHLPPPPEKRPANWGQITWSHESLSQAFTKIYEYRSKALHEGVPFPAPMCEPPVKEDPSWQAAGENLIGRGLAISMHGGTWLATDLPMTLHVFEYIARRAINACWSSVARPPS